MKNNHLNHYVIGRLKSITQHFSAYTKDKKPQRLHHLRVDIKKIKAVFSFAEKVYKEKYKTNTLKPLFQKAGKIREIQINTQLLNEFPQPPEKLITQLKKKENILSLQFIKYSSRYLKLIKTLRENIYLPEILPSKKKIKKYFKKEEQKANKKLKNKDKAHVHQYRMKIKKIMYIFKALPNSIQQEIELDETKINKQQKKLGSWHDTYSAINFLSLEQSQLKTAPYILKLKEKEKRQFDALFS